MKTLTLIPALLLATALTATAQDTTATRWSLQRCIEHAKANNLEVRMRQVEVDRQELTLHTARSKRLPNLSAGASQQWSFGRSASAADNTYQVQTTSSTSWSLSSDVPLFTGFEIPNEIAAARLDLMALAADLQKTRENMEITVTSAYLQVLFDKELLSVAENKLALSRTQLDRTRKIHDAGRASEAQIYETEAQVAADELSTVQATNDLRIATLTLTQLLELPSPEGFDVEPPTEADTTFLLARRPDDIYRTALTTRAAVRAEELRLQSSEKQVRVAQSALYPSLSFGASYNNAFYHIYNKPNTPFANQIRDNRGLGLGLNLRIPIFNRYATRNSIRSARLGLRNQELQLENTKKALYKDIQQAYYSALSAAERYRSATVAWQSAEKAFTFTGDRFENGRATTYEYNEAKTNLIKALSDRTQAKYEFLLRKKILEFYEQQ